MFKKLFQSRFLSVFWVAVLIFFVISVIGLRLNMLSLEKEIAIVEQKLYDIKKTREESEKLAEYFNSPAYLERQARIKLNYKKPDENVVYVYDQVTEKNKNDTEKTKTNQVWSEKFLNTRFIKNAEAWIKYIISISK